MAEASRDAAVGVLGAASLVGACLLPLLGGAGLRVIGYTRRAPPPDGAGLSWRQPLQAGAPADAIPLWICLAPAWVLPAYFPLLQAHGARRVVLLSSTSRYSKEDSGDGQERALARRLAEAEAALRTWAAAQGVEWVILRPTLIYGLGQDKNICEIARFIRRFGFFPLFGRADGLRQPVHAADVAVACLAALRAPQAANRDYNLSGAETLSYRHMVGRVFAALGRPPRLVTIPLWSFRLALGCLRRLPPYRKWSAAMAERMNRDLVFAHEAAARDLDFQARPFQPARADLPP